MHKNGGVLFWLVAWRNLRGLAISPRHSVFNVYVLGELLLCAYTATQQVRAMRLTSARMLRVLARQLRNTCACGMGKVLGGVVAAAAAMLAHRR